MELYDFYHNGLEGVLTIRLGAIDDQGQWAVHTYGQALPGPKFRSVKLWHIGRIPWRNIVDYDLQGDEYYPMPHVYCVYADVGTPYETLRCTGLDEEYLTELRPERQIQTAG